MNKDKKFQIRLSAVEFELIEYVAKQYDMSISQFILSVLIPFCIKNKR